MDRQIVLSSGLRSVGYDARSLILEIEFQNGSVYHYFAVPVSVHEALLSAPSKGHYFDARVKVTYRCEKIR